MCLLKAGEIPESTYTHWRAFITSSEPVRWKGGKWKWAASEQALPSPGPGAGGSEGQTKPPGNGRWAALVTDPDLGIEGRGVTGNWGRVWEGG